MVNLTVPERLRALADGENLQIFTVFGTPEARWFDYFPDSYPGWVFAEGNMFRIKPEPEMSVPVRRFFWRDDDGKARLGFATNEKGNYPFESDSTFIRWLDDDFISYPVEVKE